jgi:hypothetical protein
MLNFVGQIISSDAQSLARAIRESMKSRLLIYTDTYAQSETRTESHKNACDVSDEILSYEIIDASVTLVRQGLRLEGLSRKSSEAQRKDNTRMTEDQCYRQVEILQIKGKHQRKQLEHLVEQRESAGRRGQTARAEGLLVSYQDRLRTYLAVLDRLLQAYASLGAAIEARGEEPTLIGLRQIVLSYHEERQQVQSEIMELSTSVLSGAEGREEVS